MRSKYYGITERAFKSMIFIYDGTFDGFLSAVFDAYSQRINPSNIVSSLSEMQITLNAQYYYAETTNEKADRLMTGMNKISGQLSNQVILAFLSYMPGKEMVIYRYIAMAFRIKKNIFLKLDDDIVRKMLDMCGQTDLEKQKWKGFLRFSVMENNVYYAEMSPKNNVLTLVMPHFCRRFNTKPFLIHDITYKQVGLYDKQEWHLLHSEGLTLPDLHSDESKYRYMWKLFYDTTAVEGRKNHKRRRQVMPERYRKHITELQEQSFSDNFNEEVSIPVKETECTALAEI